MTRLSDRVIHLAAVVFCTALVCALIEPLSAQVVDDRTIADGSRRPQPAGDRVEPTQPLFDDYQDGALPEPPSLEGLLRRIAEAIRSVRVRARSWLAGVSRWLADAYRNYLRRGLTTLRREFVSRARGLMHRLCGGTTPILMLFLVLGSLACRQ